MAFRFNTRLRPAGTVVMTGERGSVQHETLMCVHCGRHWPLNRNTLSQLGSCSRCGGPTCGKACQECVPLEKRIELLERRLS